MSVTSDKIQTIAVFWFRRDLRLHDNAGLFHALTSGFNVLPVFIFDSAILDKLNGDDKRVSFISQALDSINHILAKYQTTVQLFYGKPALIFNQLLATYSISTVFANHDYEPYALERDQQVKALLAEKGVLFRTFKDQVVFEKDEVVKPDGEPYTVFTPYSRKWLEKLNNNAGVLHCWNSSDYIHNFFETETNRKLEISDFGFNEISNVFKPFELNEQILQLYDKTRDFPALDSTSKVSVHLRFGTVSVRDLVAKALTINPVWLNELIWREFFMQILWHFPHVVNKPFKPRYQFINWLNNESDFNSWCKGETGFPMVDAGMRELNETGFMHNRVRMVTASFLVKHLLVNWQWGEAYMATKLLDFELSSNNGNWQWAAGTGCDSAPYFRIFNPMSQAEKFDSKNIYIKKWVPEFGSSSYIQPIVDHSSARSRCLETYKSALESSFNNI
jgi:deoxyribodipyrimidine photo-lyase